MPISQAGRVACCQLALQELETRETPSVTFRLDYSLDTYGFFNDPSRREAMQRAVDAIAPRLNDSLAAITPSGRNSWQATFFNPITNSNVTLTNPVIGQNELVIYVAGAPMGDGELGLTTTGGFSASGTRAWLDTVRSRGQAGASGAVKTDYSNWGGMITFDSRPNWNFSSGNPAPNQYDFESVALHEISHILGFGLGEPAFTKYISGGLFTGPAVQAVMGGPVPVVGSPPDHWAQGTTSDGRQSPLAASLPQGQKRLYTPLDYAALSDIGWELGTVTGSTAPVSTAPITTAPVLAAASAPTTTGALPTITPTTSASPTSTPTTGTTPRASETGSGSSSPVTAAPSDGVRRFVAGTTSGATIYDSEGAIIKTVRPFAPVSSAVRVAQADITADGVPDVVVASGPGQSNVVAVVDGRSGETIVQFQPFESTFTGGLYVATGDFNSDGKVDLVVTPDESGGPVVAIYDGGSLAAGRVSQLNRFWGIADSNFRGGARPGVGDIDGNGTPDLVVSAGIGGGPRIAIFNGSTISNEKPSSLVGDFFAYESSLRNGAYVSVGDLDHDGQAEIVVGAGPGGGPRIRAFSGRELMAGRNTTIADFFGGSTTNRGGVRVALHDLNDDGRLDLILGDGGNSTGRITAYTAQSVMSSNPSFQLSLAPIGVGTDGVFVG